MAEVVLKNICKKYDNNFEAVKNVNLTVKDKEFMVIVGPSGCGKSTTLRMIAGLEDITGGELFIGDTKVNDVPPKNRDIAMVFQNYALYPHMTVYQNMAFGLKLRKVHKVQIDKIVRDTAMMLGIEQLLDRKPKALSGGQRQRVALGRAIVRKPKAFLFDEPLSNLDAKLRVTTRADLKSLHLRLATTSIYVTHDQVEAMTLGDRICVMYNGQIQQVAAPMEVYERPVNRFVAGFLGTPPMNFFEGKLERENDVMFFRDSCQSVKIMHNNKLAAYVGTDVVLGVRPEHISLSSKSEYDIPFNAVVEIIESLGDKQDIYFRSVNGNRFIGSVEPHLKLMPGEKVTLYLDHSRIHLFESGETGANILL